MVGRGSGILLELPPYGRKCQGWGERVSLTCVILWANLEPGHLTLIGYQFFNLIIYLIDFKRNLILLFMSL